MPTRYPCAIRPTVLLCVWAFASIAFLSGRAAAEENFARWERNIAAFEAQDRESPPRPGGIVFIGSSSIVRWDVRKDFPDLPVVNRGFGGSQLADSVHFAPRILLPHRPATVVLYAGDNDLNAGKTPEKVRDDFTEFVRVVHSELPQARILFISIKPSTRRWSIVDRIREANAMVAEICAKDERLEYVDIFTPSLNAEGLPRRDLLVADGLHLSRAGYDVWVETVRPLLTK